MTQGQEPFDMFRIKKSPGAVRRGVVRMVPMNRPRINQGYGSLGSPSRLSNGSMLALMVRSTGSAGIGGGNCVPTSVSRPMTSGWLLPTSLAIAKETTVHENPFTVVVLVARKLALCNSPKASCLKRTTQGEFLRHK